MQITKRFSHFFFATKVWLTSVLLTPTLFYFFDFSTILGSTWTYWEAAGLMVMFGGLFSIPNWILFIIATWLIQKNQQIQEKKKVLTITAVILSAGLFYGGLDLIGLYDIVDKIPLIPLGYILTLVFGIWFFPLRKINQFSWEDQILDDNLF